MTPKQRAAVEAMERFKSQRKAAAALGICKSTLQERLKSAGTARAEQKSDPSPKEIRDAAFFRKRVRDLESELDKVTHFAEELAGLRANVDPAPPTWVTQPQSHHSRSVPILHTSDLHYGETIKPGEISGINEYNPEIARERMRKLFDAACTIAPRWMDGGPCDGILLTMAGDMISGDIHEELMRTNALTSHEQVQGVIEIYDAGIRQLADAFGKVHVPVVTGNHGRTTVRNSFKLAGALSYDNLIGAMLRDRFRDDDRVSFAIADGFDLRVPLYGRTIVVTHGHMMGTGGGQGFAGPVLPIIRGGHKVRLQSQSAKLDCDLLLIGHYHTSAAPPGILANGSVVGYGEFANGIRAAVEPPKQWLARFSSSWGLCETLAVQLEESPTRMRFRA